MAVLSRGEPKYCVLDTTYPRMLERLAIAHDRLPSPGRRFAFEFSVLSDRVAGKVVMGAYILRFSSTCQSYKVPSVELPTQVGRHVHVGGLYRHTCTYETFFV